MKLNLKKVATKYSAVIDGYNVEFGWYDSGKAFIAKDGETISYKEAWSMVAEKVYRVGNYFYFGRTTYDKNMSGIVHYLIDKYCR